MSAQSPTPDDLRVIAVNLTTEGHGSRAEVLRNVANKLDAMRAAIETAKEAIDLALNWGPKTQSDEYLIETRLKEAFDALDGVK